MADVVYIGDEISAAGWRLAGAGVAVPGPGDEAAALAGAGADAALVLVLVSAVVAARIDPAVLAAAGSALMPLVLVLPDPQGQVSLPGLASRLRSQLGLET